MQRFLISLYCEICQRTLPTLDSLISQACSVQSNGSLCQASILPGNKTRGRGPSVSYQEAQYQRTDRFKLAFLWAWVGAIGQESFYIWSLSQSQFGERLFLSLKGWHVPLYVVCNICNIFQFFQNKVNIYNGYLMIVIFKNQPIIHSYAWLILLSE